ncbi:MAG: hypothetical protein PHR95_10270, partial [Acidithiobacillus sp.]|nr:hypothetical protein [Acidithiobacillus sp.]
MATIRSREDQDGFTIGWQAQIKRKGFPLQVKTFRTKAEAKEWATVTESEMMRGIWRDRGLADSTMARSKMKCNTSGRRQTEVRDGQKIQAIDARSAKPDTAWIESGA